MLSRASLQAPTTIGQGLLVAVAVAYGLAAEWARASANWSMTWIAIDLLPGLAFFVVGVITWRRRPGNRIGAILFAIGLAWFVGTFGVTTQPLFGRLTYAFQGYYDALLAWLVLAYPSGRLTTRGARLVVPLYLGTFAARTVARLAVYQVPGSYDLSRGEEVQRYIAETMRREDVDFAFAILLTLISIIVLGLVVQRLLASSGAGRRVSSPILIGGIAVAVGVVVEFMARFLTPTSNEMRVLLADVGSYITAATGLVVSLAFLLGLVRTRLARGGIADLVVQLDEPGTAAPLREVLAKALRDPTLVVAYPVPGTTGFIDADGRAVSMPDPVSTDRAVTLIERGGETIAALVHDAALAEEQTLVRSVAAAARMALDNERLQAEVRAQLEEVRASRARIVTAGDAERRRIERDLHDGAQQRLVTLALALQMARSVGGESPELASLLDRAGHELASALSELRELARGVHPPLLVEGGLEAAIEALAERAPLPVEVTVDAGVGRPASAIEAAAFFVVSESLANVAKHASASHAWVRVTSEPGKIRVEIRDDGVGGADARGGSGLVGLGDRVAAVGGRFETTSPPGGGTTITAVLPCA